MTTAIHLITGSVRHVTTYPCGVDRSWPGLFVTGTRSHAAVTCGNCRRTHAYRGAS